MVKKRVVEVAEKDVLLSTSTFLVEFLVGISFLKFIK